MTASTFPAPVGGEEPVHEAPPLPHRATTVALEKSILLRGQDSLDIPDVKSPEGPQEGQTFRG
jgi:hypothetical protein